MSRMFTFQTSAAKVTIQDLEGDNEEWRFPKGSLDESFGVVLLNKNHIHCVRCNDDSVVTPMGFEAYSDPQIAPFGGPMDMRTVVKKEKKVHSSTTMPILHGLITSGELKGADLETIEEEPGSGMREHDCLTLILPSGQFIRIDTVCSGVMENVGIIIDNARPPAAPVAPPVVNPKMSGFYSPTSRDEDESWKDSFSANEVASIQLLMDVQHQLEMGNYANDKTFVWQIQEHLTAIGVRK